MPVIYSKRSGVKRRPTNMRAARAVASIARQSATQARRFTAALATMPLSAGPTTVTRRFASTAYRHRGVEIKTLDLQFTGAYNAAYTPDTQPQQRLNTNTNTACVQALSLIQQGTGIAQRDGNKVSLKSVRLRLNIVPTGVASNIQPQRVRVMLLYDRQPNGSYQATSTILGESLQSNSIGAGVYTSSLNPNFFERYVVLMDKFITLPPATTGGDAANATNGPTCIESFVIDEFVYLKDLEVVYNGTANPMTIAQHSVGSLQIACVGDSAPTADYWALTGSARLRFRDN